MTDHAWMWTWFGLTLVFAALFLWQVGADDGWWRG